MIIHEYAWESRWKNGTIKIVLEIFEQPWLVYVCKQLLGGPLPRHTAQLFYNDELYAEESYIEGDHRIIKRAVRLWANLPNNNQITVVVAPFEHGFINCELHINDKVVALTIKKEKLTKL